MKQVKIKLQFKAKKKKKSSRIDVSSYVFSVVFPLCFSF